MADSLKPSEQGKDILGSALKTVEDGDRDASRMVRRHFRLESRRTSICLHPEEWSMFDLVSKRLGYNAKALINEIDRTRGSSSVPSAMRVFMLGYWRDLARMNAGRATQASTAAAKGSSVMTASTPQPMRLAARSGSFTV